MTADALAELIAIELDRQGLEPDNLGDCETVILLSDGPVINLKKLAELILREIAKGN